MNSRYTWVAIVGSLLSFTGCVGTVGPAADLGSRDRAAEPGTASPGTDGAGGRTPGRAELAGSAGTTGGGVMPGVGGMMGSAGSGGGAPPIARVFVPQDSPLRRLTADQYRNSVRDILGMAAPPSSVADIEPDTSLNGFASIGASRVAVSLSATEKFGKAGADLARMWLTDPGRRMALVGCAPSASADDTCALQFIQRFLRRAFRRPASAEELTDYNNLAIQSAKLMGDGWVGLEQVVAAALQSPNFIYRTEIGSPDSKRPGTRTLSGFEVATRLSYLLWNTTPDEKLLDAAVAGKLDTADGLNAETTRLLSDSRSKLGLRTFFIEMLNLSALDRLTPSPKSFPMATATIGPSMREETLLVIDELIGKDADFGELFTGRSTFVNAELARFYGITPVPLDGNFAKASYPATSLRAGLLGQASLLTVTSHTESHSPTKRGKMIREILLCQSTPPVPADVSTTLPTKPPNVMQTMRERLEEHRMRPACAGCHALIDPLGLGLENFDALGSERTMDSGKPIDASGSLGGVSWKTPLEFAAVMRADPQTAACLIRNLYRYALGHVESEGEEVAIDDLSSSFIQGGRKMRDLVQRMVRSDSFRRAGELN